MNNNKDKRKAIVGTILFHGILLLCFIFMGLKYQNPPPNEEGIAINFGFDNSGIGQEEPNENVSSSEKPIETEEAIDLSEQISTQDIEDAFKSKKNKSEKDKKIEPKKEVEKVEQKQIINTKALFQAKKETQNTSQGISNDTGDQGQENGSINSNNYNGNGSGFDGIAFNLGGRSISTVKKPIYETQAQGKVVVSIRVNKNGKVISANPGAKGSTTTDSYLYARAKEAALQTKFNAKPDAPNVQIGTIIYHFKLY